MRFSVHVRQLRGGEGKARAGSRRRVLMVLALGVAAASLPLGARALQPSGISSVSISRQFFNPTLGEKAEVSFSVGSSGSLTLLILDRDGYIVRKLVSGQPVKPGKLSFTWDGRSDSGEVVPDEAYSFKIDLASGGHIASYFPANSVQEEYGVGPVYYDRQNGIVSYKLPKPSRVHIQAGSSRVDPKTKESDGPVLKTVVNREPRSGGSVIEAWRGYDESGSIYVPDLPNFVLAVAATALPENSVIAVGNREKGFMEEVAKRRGKSLFTFKVADRSHHEGLTTLEDVAPVLRLAPASGVFPPSEKVLAINDRHLRLSVRLEGPAAASFARQPGTLLLFLDEDRVRELPASPSLAEVEVPIEKASAGVHTVTVNWVSHYGPVAVNSVRIKVSPRGADETVSKR